MLTDAIQFWWIQVALFLGVTCLCLWLASRITSDDVLARRLRRASSDDVPKESGKAIARDEGFLVLLSQRARAVEWFIPADAQSRTRLQASLFRAGIYRPDGLVAYSCLKVLLMALPVVALLLLATLRVVRWEHAILGGCVLGALGGVVPALLLQRAVARRQRKLRRSLPDFLDLLVACIEGGLTFQAGIAEVSDELMVAHPILAGEFNMLRREMEMGRSLDTALQNLADRTAVDELRSLATFIQQSQRFGSTVADALRQMSDMLRVQREHRAEEAAQKAAVKILLPTLLCIFPSVFVVLAGPAVIQVQQSFSDRDTSALTRANAP